MSGKSAQGVQTALSDPHLTSAALRQKFQTLAEHSPELAGMSGRLIDVRKQANSIVVTLRFTKVMPEIGSVTGLAQAVCTPTQMNLVIAAGPTLASAKQRLGLVRN
ncbi:hypothetical protein C5L14_08760 [Labrys okinawensis]|uniref:Uncharacterized protein n=1 Tax=Labrys okinawensis TaxID=346911 RepID=A0A2S9QF63_9HYPH|nr:hypothetical protein [Labrys okinawensis]PRH87984.1 hypothetical protein C5L14_08760 [Labrys okinawensis]